MATRKAQVRPSSTRKKAPQARKAAAPRVVKAAQARKATKRTSERTGVLPAGDWVTVQEAADAAGASVSAIRLAYQSGRIQSIEVAGVRGTERRVLRDEVIASIKGRTSPPAPASAPPFTQPGPGVMVVPEAFYATMTNALGELPGIVREVGDTREKLGRSEAKEAFLRGRVRDLEAVAAATREQNAVLTDENAELREQNADLLRDIDELRSQLVEPQRRARFWRGT